MYLKQTAGCCSAGIHCNDSGTIVAAGSAYTQPCNGWNDGDTPAIAIIYFPDQEYTKAFCPCEALSNGTMFPELVM